MLKFECMGSETLSRQFKDLSIGDSFTWRDSMRLCMKVSEMCYYDVEKKILFTVYEPSAREDSGRTNMDIWKGRYSEKSEVRKVAFEDYTIKWRYEK